MLPDLIGPITTGYKLVITSFAKQEFTTSIIVCIVHSTGWAGVKGKLQGVIIGGASPIIINILLDDCQSAFSIVLCNPSNTDSGNSQPPVVTRLFTIFCNI